MKRTLAIALAAALFIPAAAAAQDWPTKSVKIMVPFGPGSTPDMVARLIADRLQQKLGQTFVIENKPGASGNTRNRRGRQGRARRRHDRNFHRRTAGHQHVAVLQAALRSGQGHRADHAIGHATERAGDQHQPRRQFGAGAGGAAQARAGKIQFRLDRQRLAVAPRHGSDRAPQRDAGGAHPLSRLATGDDRRAARRRADGMPAGDLGDPACRIGQGEDPRGLHRQALCAAARYPDAEGDPGSTSRRMPGWG